jgi:hypothetical protein
MRASSRPKWISSGFIFRFDAEFVMAVIAGLDPAIHLLTKNALRLFAKKMDPRVKPAGDKSNYHVSFPVG